MWILCRRERAQFKELMKPIEMNTCLPLARCTSKKVSAILIMASLSLFMLSATTNVFAQKSYSKRFPTRGSITITLNNWSGGITVEGWDKSIIEIKADMEAPTARFTPRVNDDGIVIDVVGENQGRGDIGSVNFRISVPFDSSIDIETRIGDLTVKNVSGTKVRAHVTSEGNVTLTQISSQVVMAHNVSGDILFDGVLLPQGIYSFKSMEGNINIRIPENSAFQLFAIAPRGGDITLGPFAGSGLSYMRDKHKVFGNVGAANATLTVTNQAGSITFYRR
jgi:Putative adhesin